MHGEQRRRAGTTRVAGLVAGGVLAVLLTGSPAAAQDGTDYVGGQNPTVDVPKGADPASGGRSGGDAGVDASGDARGLALTGGDVLGLTAIGAAAVGAGTVLARRSRRSTRASGAHRAPAQA